MGYIRHDSIIVTSWDKQAIKESHEKAISLGLGVSEIIGSYINGYGNFFIPPDGSKESWPESEVADGKRKEFISWIRNSELHIDWVAVSYGGDEPDTAVMIDHNKDEDDNG